MLRIAPLFAHHSFYSLHSFCPFQSLSGNVILVILFIPFILPMRYFYSFHSLPGTKCHYHFFIPFRDGGGPLVGHSEKRCCKFDQPVVDTLGFK